MATFTVTTIEDIIDAGDGLFSLREAVAAANASADADTIVFSPSIVDGDTQTITVDDSAFFVEAAGGALTIIGDVDDNGLADIILNAGFHHHFTIGSAADLTLIGMDLIGGQLVNNGGSATNGGDGGRGEDLGIASGVADFFPVSILANRLEIESRAGTDGHDGQNGGAGGEGANGADGLDQSASIDNSGSLSLVRVGFGLNSGFGENGGNAGRGGNGGFGEQGGQGFPGISVTRGNGVLLNGKRIGNGVVEGGDGGDGGDGGRGGDGGDGGSGGAVAGAILNREGGEVELTDVSFGGSLLSGVVFGGMSAIGGQGGRPGPGGTGGGGRSGGDGGAGGVIFDITTNDDNEQIAAGGPAGNGGNGGNGGISGDGGDGGAFGDAGSAAGAILNKGVVSGGAAFIGNTASAGTTRPTDIGDLGFGGGFTNVGASAGDPAGPGGASTFDSRTGLDVDVIGQPGMPGLSGQAGKRGANFQAGGAGQDADDILNLGSGGSTVEQSPIIVFAHGVETAQEDTADDPTLQFNLLRIGSRSTDVIVSWEVRPADGSTLSGADFVGGVLPSGVAMLIGVTAAEATREQAVETVEIALAADGLAEMAEGLTFIITDAQTDGGAPVAIGTAAIAGVIRPSDALPDNPDEPVDPDNPDVDPPLSSGPTTGADELTGGNGGDDIAGLQGNDTITGLGGADTLSGGGGRDVLLGNGGKDVLLGGGGADSLVGGGGKDDLAGNGGKDTLEGGGGKDTLDGGGGRDLLQGGGGRDILDGGSGKDTMQGGNGRDDIFGGRGSDTLTGEGGGDRFIFDRGNGRDTITDFQQNRDKIVIEGGAESFDDLVISQVGNDVRILIANTRVTVEDDLIENFSVTDFIF